jgi:hypothetical protein
MTNIPTIIKFFPGATNHVWHDFCTCACNSRPQIINLQTLMIYRQKLQAQLQKSHQTCCITPEKKFIIGGIFALLHQEVTMNCNSDIMIKLDAYGYISMYLVFIYHLLMNVYIFSKLLRYFWNTLIIYAFFYFVLTYFISLITATTNRVTDMKRQ